MADHDVGLIRIIKIIPQPEELQIINRLNQGILMCTEMGCSYVASNTSTLGLHKAKIHNIKNVSEEGTDKHYHCPVFNCCYNSESERYFKSIDVLRTHYMKVHSDKKFSCKKCDKTFGLERDCLRHEKECGETFFCPDCKKIFTNKPALFRHCDYNRHKRPELTKKVTPVKVVQPPKGKDEDKRKPLPVNKKTLPFILPKQSPTVLYSPSSLQHHSLQIQTDEMGAQYIISKMASERSVSQSVQTMEKAHASATKTAGIQTVPQTWSRINMNNNNQIRKLSTGIQTAKPQTSNMSVNLSVAQTQTGEAILKKAMKAASIPVVKLCKATQKSPGKSGRGKRKSSGTCTSGSQTPSTLAPRKKVCEYPTGSHKPIISYSRGTCDKQSQQEIESSFTDLMSTMSTQTNLSCVPQQFLTQSPSFDSGMQLQDCHTQTNMHTNFSFAGQYAHTFINQNTQTTSLLSINDQITQTTLHCMSSDQKTQTGSDQSKPYDVFGFLSIQDSQTQTLGCDNGTGIINNNETQTQKSDINISTGRHDQGTSCDGLLNLDMVSSPSDPFSLLPLSFQNTTTDPILLENSNFYTTNNGSVSKDISLNSDNGRGEDLLLQTVKSNSLVSSDSTEALADLLMEVIDQNETSLKDSSTAQATLQHGSQTDDQMESMVENSDASMKLTHVSSMETQTFGSLGMDSMTQTMDDLVFEMGTQTVEDLVSDMMTQTGDDLLEYLTNDIQTQTLDDFYGQLTTESLPEKNGNGPTSFMPLSTAETSTQINLSTLFGDNASTQTMWDADDQALDLHSSSFAAPWHSGFNNVGRESQTRPGSFLDREDNPDSASNFSHGRKLLKHVENYFTKVTSTETVEDQISANDSERVTESSQTQTVYDPLFSNLDSDNLHRSEYVRPKTCKESSHTQTSFDPMLSSMLQDDDMVLLSQQNIFVQKETTETQTLAEIEHPSRETAECQTSWDDFITSVETSETQTYNADLFGNNFVSSTDTDTQTQCERDLGQKQNLDFTDSFTQTSLDQNIQTAIIKTLKEVM